jgi:hypothetical protein
VKGDCTDPVLVDLAMHTREIPDLVGLTQNAGRSVAGLCPEGGTIRNQTLQPSTG